MILNFTITNCMGTQSSFRELGPLQMSSYYFFGGMTLKEDDVDFSEEDIAVLDFAVGLKYVVDDIKTDPRQIYTFADKDVSLEFRLENNEVRIRKSVSEDNFGEEYISVELPELAKKANTFLDDVVNDIYKQIPEARASDTFQQLIS